MTWTWSSGSYSHIRHRNQLQSVSTVTDLDVLIEKKSFKKYFIKQIWIQLEEKLTLSRRNWREECQNDLTFHTYLLLRWRTTGCCSHSTSVTCTHTHLSQCTCIRSQEVMSSVPPVIRGRVWCERDPAIDLFTCSVFSLWTLWMSWWMFESRRSQMLRVFTPWPPPPPPHHHQCLGPEQNETHLCQLVSDDLISGCFG